MTATDVQAPLVARLPAVFGWTDGGRDVVAEVLSVHRRRVAEAMCALLERVGEPTRTGHGPGSAVLGQLAPAWAAADRRARSRVTLAPATSRRLLWTPHRPHEACRWITGALAHEAAAAGSSGRVRRGLWSALGDANIGPGLLPGVPAAAPHHAGTVAARPGDGHGRDGPPAAIYRAPVVGGLVPLDAWSPLARSFPLWRGTGACTTWPEFDEAGLRDVTRRLGDALASVRETSSVAATLVESFTFVVVLRGPGCGFRHGSTLVDVGRTVIRDPLSPAATQGRLAEALVHEAVHHLCNVTVRGAPWVDDGAVAMPIESPWTGNPLPLWGYLQACLVWAALRTFWARALDRGTFEATTAAARGAVAERGFESGPPMDRIPRQARALVDPLVVEVIRSASRS